MDGTIFIVCQGHDTQDWRPALSKNGETAGWQFQKSNSDFGSFTVRGTSDADTRSGGSLFNGQHRVWAMRKSEFRKSQWADGSLEFEVVDSGAISPASDSDLIIGARDHNGITSFASVEIGEIMIFDSALSDQEVLQVQGYLAHKWGLTEIMPDSHPFKDEKPAFENRPAIQIRSPYPLLKDQNLTLFLTTDRPADSFAASNLPSGLNLDGVTGEISGLQILPEFSTVNFKRRTKLAPCPRK